MCDVCLIRPYSAPKTYGELLPVSAFEPPHWMLVRARQLRDEHKSVVVVDLGLGKLSDIPEAGVYEIWPSGVHPSAFVQELEGVAGIVQFLSGRVVWVRDSMPFDPTNVSPAWDMVDPFDYRCHNWQAWGYGERSGYGTVHSSISCPFGCSFCTVKGFYGGAYRERNMNDVASDLLFLYDLGVRNFKMMDELFIVSDARLQEWALAVLERGLTDLNVWGYARVDTLAKVSDDTLKLARGVGLRWVGLGIESGNAGVRLANGKGTFSNADVECQVGRLKRAGIATVANFMFGFPQDTKSTLRETFDLMWKLQPELANLYCVVPYPGTQLEKYARKMGWELPVKYSTYSQYTHNFTPLRTNTLISAEVLAFRDWAWEVYHSHTGYLQMLEKQFGFSARKDMEKVSGKQIHRDILGGTWEEWYGRKQMPTV